MSIVTDKGTKGRWLVFWLVLGHVLAGLIGCAVARSYHRSHSQPEAAFVGLVFSQTSLLGLWAGLGSTNWLARFGSVLVGLIYLGGLFCAGVEEVDLCLFVMIAFAGLMVAVPLVIGRCFGIGIRGSSVTGTETPTQFSIRQLMILTFLVATLLTAAKWLIPHVGISGELPFLLLISVPFIILGLVAAWSVLGTKHPMLGTVAVLLLAPLLGFGFDLFLKTPFPAQYSMAMTTTAVVVLLVSLHAIRRCGLRIWRQRRIGFALGDKGPQKECKCGK